MGIVILLIILINLTPVQNFLAQKAVSYLSGKLDTKVALKHVRIDLLNALTLEGLYIEDKQGDTLLYAGAAQLKITDWFFLKDKPVISYVGLKNAYANLRRKRSSDQWNYQFIIDAFSSAEPKSPKKKPSKLDMDLRKVDLQQVRFHMIDEWTGSDMIGEVEDFTVNARKIDFEKKIIDIASIEGKKVLFGLRDYKGGKPPAKKKSTAPVIDTTPFNPDHWNISLRQLTLKDSRFFLKDPDEQAPDGMFEATQMDITGIQLDAGDIRIKGDTLTGNLNLLQGKERCGLKIKKMSARVTVSPNLAECKDLVLLTENSSLGSYYAMHYDRFPDFTEYITNVVMVADFKNAEVGIQDIVYFAPALKRFENISVKVSGEGNGTVEKLTVKNLALNDGLSQLKGELYMNGLPDIDHTFIDFQKGELKTNGAAAFLYVPELKNDKTINLAGLSSVAFNGSFTGFISDFAAAGVLTTNLGNAKANINMKLPARGLPSYSGALAADHFDIGTLLNQTIVGAATFDVQIEGKGFDAASASIDVDGLVKEMVVNGYNYQQVKVDGLLAAKQFDGHFSARDPNLALDFDGKIDFSGKEPMFDVYAQLAHINTRALHFTADSITAKGNMQLQFTGSNIDNFIGSAYIYDIDILRG
jgi:hypothetical protein